MIHEFNLGTWLSRLRFDFKPKVCAATAYGCTFSQRTGRQREGIHLQADWYCSAECFERGVLTQVKKLRGLTFRRTTNHRIPLGLMLLSRGAITESQLCAALSAQRNSGNGRLGEWLQRTGAAGEYEITKALSEQWSCPMLRANSPNLGAASLVPWALLESHRMMPFHFATPDRTMYVAFSEQIVYPVLTAIEHMLDCRTEACVITQSEMDHHLGERRGLPQAREVVFERVQSDLEIAATVRSYALECSTKAARISSCGMFLWVRLLTSKTFDLLFRLPPDSRASRPRISQPI